MIIDKINSDFKEALKSRDSIKTLSLRLLKTKISNFEKIDGKQATDKDILKILEKSKSEVIQTISYTENPSKLEELNTELSIYDRIYSEFAPKKMTQSELEQVISDLKSKNMTIGEIMSYLKSNYEGLYDGKTASMLAKN